MVTMNNKRTFIAKLILSNITSNTVNKDFQLKSIIEIRQTILMDSS